MDDGRDPDSLRPIVLLVDDDSTQRRMLRHVLEPCGYEIVEARDSLRALEIIRTQELDVVVLDKRMPGIDGDEVCRRVRNELNLGLLPILMLTGAGCQEELASSLSAGASDFLRKPYNLHELRARIASSLSFKRLTDELDCVESVLYTLARMVEAKDGTTGDHCSRLARSAEKFGERLGLEEQQLSALRRGGVLHDIGKLGIPDRILLKSDSLNDDEWAVMRTHPEIGARLCGHMRSLRLTVPIIRHHHERWDGTGYPDGLKGESIPLLARIFQIADIFDALAHERPYKSAWGYERSFEHLKVLASSGVLDPQLVKVFCEMGVRAEPVRAGMSGTGKQSIPQSA